MADPIDADQSTGLEIAIIGMTGRFPNASTIEQFWRNLCDGSESITFFSDDELLAAQVDPAELLDPSYVKAGAVLDGIELFDAAFFGFSPREAQVMDPQQRLFLECSWEALERAGYDSDQYRGAIGVFAGVSANSYLLYHLYTNPEAVRAVGEFQVLIGNDRDFLATQVSYKLNLEGPSMVIQTACSSSLVAVHVACQSLLSGECDMALAGGSSINIPHTSGYLYQPGGIASPDGHCRAFDEQAQGTIRGSGVGVVVLKRLSDAISDGDTIQAVIRGSAINNDGGRKVGYTAPRTEGQAKVIRAAQLTAEVDPETISYVEAHGTGTALGDPIEIAALTQAFRQGTDRTQFCAIGSVKTNIGHLDTSAGIASLIKTTLALRHKQVPPSLHFETPNSKIDFANSPFYVNTKLRPWRRNGTPRRAGVSSFGMGGTNAHLILEEAPQIEPSDAGRPSHLLVLSAKTATALEAATANLAAFLREQPALNLADVAYTLQVGRKPFKHRRALVCGDQQEAIELLETLDPKRVLSSALPARDPAIVFMFPGQGAQYIDMARDLYRTEPLFEELIDHCSALLLPHLGLDLRTLLFPDEARRAQATQQLTETAYAQPALFVVEYALARLWLAWGFEPQALIGHSIGEYAAACLAEVMSLQDALELVAARGRLMQQCATGSMLAVSLSMDEVTAMIDEPLSLAAVNAPALCVVAGPTAAITALQQQLEQRGVHCRPLHTSHAFHSALMEPAVAPFTALVRRVELHPPRRPLISNVTGTWMTDAQALDPTYWADQLRQPVQFAAGLAELLRTPQSLLLEVGPGQTLSTFARQQLDPHAQQQVFPSLRHPQDHVDDQAFLLQTLGRCWLAGAAIDWSSYYRDEQRQRVVLPTYPFERQRYWVDAPRGGFTLGGAGIAEHAASDDTLDEPLSPQHARPHLYTAYVAPGDETEQQVAEIWQRLFGFDQVGIHDNFFELGGHSLLALQLIFQLREAFRVELSLSSLFDSATVAELATYIAQAQTEPAQATQLVELPTIVPDPAQHDQPFPITDVQHAYWIGRHELFELGNVGSHFYVEIECEALDLARFNTALDRLIERHAMLRAIIRPDGQQQILASVPRYEIVALNLRGLDAAATAAQLEAVREEMVAAVMPAERWPLFDIRATAIDEQHTRLHVKIDFLIADAQSIETMMRDLASLYVQPSLPLAMPELSYRDYMVATVALQQTELYHRSQEYWQRRIPLLPPPPQLPLLPAVDSSYTPYLRRRSGLLDRPTWSTLKTRAARLGVTPSVIVCAAYSEILAAWSEQSHFTINLTLFNRLPLHPQVNDIVGDFTSTTLLEVNHSGGTLTTRAKRLQEQLWRDMDHQYFSGVRVLREINRVQGTSAAGVMPFIFTSLLTQEQQVEDGPSVAWLGETGYSSSQSPQIMIDHQVGEENGALIFVWDVLEEAFPAGLIDAMFTAFQGLLLRLAQEDAVWQSEQVALVPPGQLEQRASVNATDAPVPNELLHTLFSQRAAAQPDQLAISASQRSLTYQQVVRAANRIGCRLREAGAQTNRLVAVVMEKGWEQIVGVLGVMEAGAAYLPIDPDLPQERLWYILAHGEVEHVLTQSHIDARLSWPAHVRRWHVDRDEPWQGDNRPLESVQQPTDLAYVIYTSGSTGQPKGVAIDHRGAVNTILDINQRFAVTDQDRVLALSSLSFDLSVYDIFGTLAAGGTIVMPDAALSRDPAHWADLLLRERVTLWNSVPALLQMLVEYSDCDAERLGQSLRLVLLSGDWIPLTLPDQIRALVPAVEVISLGGATEASIWSILYPIPAVDPDWRSIPYGRAMLNQRFYVLNADFEPRPIWVPGALYIAGIGLAQGYWRDQEKTQASFFVHPRTGERLYRTGDLGRFLPDGNIEFLGRVDQQVKIQGYRIELGEVEAALMQHPAIQNAVVIAVGSRHGNKHLVAYVVGAQSAEHDQPAPQASEAERQRSISLALTNELQAFLQDKLPKYMLPSAIVPLQQLPLTANGKVDRRALPEPNQDQFAVEQAYIAPHTQTQRQLAAIWEQLLSYRPISVQRNFFDLGGDSLLATQLMTRVRACFELELPLRTLFDAPTITELAAQIERLRGQRLRHRAPSLAAVVRGDQLPLSFAQQRMWYLEQLEPGSPAHLIPGLLRLHGPLDADLLERSINQVITRHETLRTTFGTVQGQPIQIITPRLWLPLRRIDLRTLDALTQEEELYTLLDQDARQPFDLGQGPLLRTSLLQTAAQDYILLLTMHHIISDGWSLGIFLRELITFYEAAGQPDVLPALPVQYADFALWQRGWIEGEVLDEMLGYWRRQLRPEGVALPVCELPTDYPRPATQTSHGATYDFRLSLELSEALRTLSQQERATLFMTLLAAFDALLFRYTGQEDVVVGSNIANRNWAEIEGLIGFFANTLVLHNTVSGADSFRQLLRDVRDTTLEAQSYQELPFELLVEALQPARDPSRTPLFQIMFVFQNMLLAAGESASLTISPLEVDSKAAKFDLTLFMQDSAQGIAGTFEYNTDLFAPTTIARLCGHFQSIVEGIVADPDSSIQDLPLTAAVEHEEQFDDFYR